MLAALLLGSCEFGAVEAKCEVTLSAHGCAGEDPNTCTAVDRIAVTREESGQLFLTKAAFCDGGTQMCRLGLSGNPPPHTIVAQPEDASNPARDSSSSRIGFSNSRQP